MRDYDNALIKSLIYSAPPAFFDNRILFGEDKEKIASAFMRSTIAGWQPSKHSPFLLLGFIGTGKSIFLDYYFYVLGPEEASIQACICDLLSAPTTKDRFIMRILLDVNRRIDFLCPENKDVSVEMLKRVFKNEVLAIQQTFSDAKEGDTALSEFFRPFPTCETAEDLIHFRILVKSKLEYMMKKIELKQFWLILDNLDQHYHFMSPDVFTEALSLAEDLRVPIVIAMRYVTLDTVAARETWDAHQPRRLNLSLPEPLSLITKRVHFLSNDLGEILDKPLEIDGESTTVRELLGDVTDTLAVLRESKDFRDFIVPLSNYNMRRLLEMLLVSFQSRYFYYDYFSGKRSTMTHGNVMTRFIQSQLLRNARFYSPDSHGDDKFLINVFENEDQDVPGNQLIRVRLLQSASNLGQNTTLSRYYGYINSVFNYDKQSLLSCLNTLLKHQLIAIQDKKRSGLIINIGEEGLEEKHLTLSHLYIALTYAGFAHLKFAQELAYLEIVKFSTYVYAHEAQTIQDVRRQTKFSDRAPATIKFLDYLIQEENKERNELVHDIEKYDRDFPRLVTEMAPKIVSKLDDLSKSILGRSLSGIEYKSGE